MKHIKSDSVKWDDREGYSKKIFFTEERLSHKGLRVQQLKIKPGETAKSHYHKKQTAVFYFLNNNGYFVVNGEKVNLGVGDLLVIEPMDKHEIINNTNEDFLYLAFKFDYEEGDSFWEK